MCVNDWVHWSYNPKTSTCEPEMQVRLFTSLRSWSGHHKTYDKICRALERCSLIDGYGMQMNEQASVFKKEDWVTTFIRFLSDVRLDKAFSLWINSVVQPIMHSSDNPFEMRLELDAKFLFYRCRPRCWQYRLTSFVLLPASCQEVDHVR